MVDRPAFVVGDWVRCPGIFDFLGTTEAFGCVIMVGERSLHIKFLLAPPFPAKARAGLSAIGFTQPFIVLTVPQHQCIPATPTLEEESGWLITILSR